jgi:hypothetical protein
MQICKTHIQHQFKILHKRIQLKILTAQKQQQTNPDGSKTTTRTDTKTDPDTGEVTTTVTETTTMPDGSTSTKTETSTQTKPKPETTELPAFCDYAATLCTWMNRDTEHKADENHFGKK